MTLTIHEAIDQLKSLLGHCKTMRESGEIWARDCEALRIAIAALRGPTREQVENLQGEWLFPIFVGQKEANDPRCQCSECGSIETPLARHRFCPSCGAPMTDAAVDIVMKRLEELYETE